MILLRLNHRFALYFQPISFKNALKIQKKINKHADPNKSLQGGSLVKVK